MVRAVPQRRTNRSMNGLQLLHKAAKSKQWRFLVDNSKRMRGVFGEADEKTKTIKINKKLHAVKAGGHLMKNPDGTEKLLGTIVHEEEHAKHPKMHEKTVRKVARKKVKVMHRKTKERLYSRLRRA